jgi:ParB family chromosome partitioning protein
MLAPIATAYEQAMTEGEGKNTWRTDRYSPCPRHEAGSYLAFLAGIGYRLSDIEQAVANGASYTGDMPSSDALAAAPGEHSGDLADDWDRAGEPASVSRCVSNNTHGDASDSTNTVRSDDRKTAA